MRTPLGIFSTVWTKISLWKTVVFLLRELPSSWSISSFSKISESCRISFSWKLSDLLGVLFCSFSPARENLKDFLEGPSETINVLH